MIDLLCDVVSQCSLQLGRNQVFVIQDNTADALPIRQKTVPACRKGEISFRYGVEEQSAARARLCRRWADHSTMCYLLRSMRMSGTGPVVHRTFSTKPDLPTARPDIFSSRTTEIYKSWSSSSKTTILRCDRKLSNWAMRVNQRT